MIWLQVFAGLGTFMVGIVLLNAVTARARTTDDFGVGVIGLVMLSVVVGWFV